MASGVNADYLRDRELAQWLEQRLDGQADDLWTASRNLCSVITKELLANIPSCFVDLQTHAKLKTLLSILYFPKRNVEQWRDEIEDILSLACQDTDEWVQTIAELLKEYPTTGGISLNMDHDGNQFTKTLQEIRKSLRRNAKGPCSQVLPLDATYMNKQAAQSTWGIQNQQPSTVSARYFSLKRKPKAAAQRIDFLQKSADAATQMKYKNNGSLSSILPIRHKNTIRRMDDQTPLKGIPTQSPARSASSALRPGAKPINRQVSMSSSLPRHRSLGNGPSAGSGVKLIDINDTPQALEKKRKTMEAEEKAAKKAAKEEMKRQRDEEKTQKKLQRDLKVQRSLEQLESRVSESSTSGLAEGLNAGEGAGVAYGAEVLVQPTPDYAAELFDGTLPAARPIMAATVQPFNTVPPSAPVFNSKPAVLMSPMPEMYAGSTSLALPIPTGGATSETSAAAVTPSTPFFFTPANMAAIGNSGVGQVAVAAPAPTSVDLPTPSADASPTRPKGSSKKRTAAKSTAKTTDAAGNAKSASRSKKRKADAAAEEGQMSPTQQQQRPSGPGQAAGGINAQPISNAVRFQFGTTPTTAEPSAAIPPAGRGLAQMAQNYFVHQQVIPQQQRFGFVPQAAQQQLLQGQQQVAGPRTILLLQQAGGQQAPSTVSFYSAAPGTSVVVRPQQPTQSMVVPRQTLASFTPSVIRSPSTATTSPTVAAVPQQSLLQQLPGTSDDAKKTFTITKDVMLKAQEMFRTANKLSRPEKALILGFMAGNRENPCPQMGRVLTVRLSENQDLQQQADGTTKAVMVETYFQMNYDNGEWKQIRKIRPLRDDEGEAA